MDASSCQWCRHQQSAEKLTRRIAADAHLAAAKSAAFDNHGRKSVAQFAAAVRAKLIQSSQQIADRPLAHSLNAVESIRPITQGTESRQKADRRAAVADKKVRLFCRNPTAAAVDDECLPFV